MSRSKYLIGLTGGIASGKNLAADVLRGCGAAVVDADQVSRDLAAPGSPLLERIADAWGRGILRADGSLDRAALAARVFGKPEQVARLNALTHPAIMAEMERRARAASEPVVVLMAPLLLEAGGESRVDEIWAVAAAPELRIARVLQRDGLDAAEARARVAAQMTEEERCRRARVVLRNEGSVAELLAQTRAAWDDLQRRRQQQGPTPDSQKERP